VFLADNPFMYGFYGGYGPPVMPNATGYFNELDNANETMRTGSPGMINRYAAVLRVPNPLSVFNAPLRSIGRHTALLGADLQGTTQYAGMMGGIPGVTPNMLWW
jgi:hypothetical protein